MFQGDAERNLLFGLMALQTGLIDQRQLVAAFGAWARARAVPLAAHLAARGDLDAEQRAGVEALVALHVKKHDGSTVRSLAALEVRASTRDSLKRAGGQDVEATLSHIQPRYEAATIDSALDGWSNLSYSVGSVTSEGQRFRIIRPHARGGLGAVFVALDTELRREVALKQILESHADDPISRQRFVLEAEVTGGLEHPGIVPVYGLGTHPDGRPYYAMRFIRGDSLKVVIDRFHAEESLQKDPGRRTLELRQLLRRFTDVCNAIEYAHSRGVLHRDVKPANVIVGEHGETLLVDWGLAKAMGKSEPIAGERSLMPSSSSGSSETLPGTALGTPAYMSPEQAAGDLEQLGPRSDVYSLGGTLYYLLTGRAPFEGEVIEVIGRVGKGDFSPPRQVDPTIDRALEAICVKAMALEPAGAYATARALGEDLERWMADEPVTAWREPWGRQLQRWMRAHRTAVTAGTAAVLAGVIGLVSVVAVQTRANVQLRDSLGRESRANAQLATANQDLTQAKAGLEARLDLAMEAIKTFHTGVSEDFLLKEEQFKEFREKLLESAGDFYARLVRSWGRNPT